MKIHLVISSFVLLFIIIGCAGTKTQTRSQSEQHIATDPVCAYFYDMGCIDVVVKENTPKSIYRGETYFFCSNRCKIDFDSNPSKFLTVNSNTINNFRYEKRKAFNK